MKNKYQLKKNIEFQSSTIHHDISTLSHCKTLVVSNGTFCLLPIMHSNIIQRIIYPSYMKNNTWFRFNDKSIPFNLPNYDTSWSNSKEQKDYMLTYKGM